MMGAVDPRRHYMEAARRREGMVDSRDLGSVLVALDWEDGDSGWVVVAPEAYRHSTLLPPSFSTICCIFQRSRRGCCGVVLEAAGNVGDDVR